MWPLEPKYSRGSARGTREPSRPSRRDQTAALALSLLDATTTAKSQRHINKAKVMKSQEAEQAAEDPQQLAPVRAHY